MAATNGKVDLRTIGATGLVHTSGIIQEEFLRELTGDRWYKTIKEMSEQDPLIGGIQFAIEMLCRQVSWEVKPQSPDPPDVEAAAFLNECLFRDMSFTWEDTLSEILTFLPYGWAYLEIVYKVRGGDVDDPTRKSEYDDGRVGWRKWSLRSQDTLAGWDFDEQGGIRGMRQRPPPSYSEVLIPIEKSLLFRTTARKNNPEGRSMLRNAYTSWYMKQNIQRIEAIGIERDLAGLPVAYIPPDYMSATAPLEKAQVYAEIKKIVTRIRNDEQGGVVMPMMYDESGHKMFELMLMASGGSRQFDTDKIIQRYNQMMAMTVVSDFMLLGHEQVGSFALASSKTNLFTVALGAWLDTICAVVNQYAIPRLLKLNAITVTKYPKLTHGDVESVDLGELGTYITQLAGVGVDLSGYEVQDHLLKQAGIPRTNLPQYQEGDYGLEDGVLESEIPAYIQKAASELPDYDPDDDPDLLISGFSDGSGEELDDPDDLDPDDYLERNFGPGPDEGEDPEGGWEEVDPEPQDFGLTSMVRRTRGRTADTGRIAGARLRAKFEEWKHRRDRGGKFAKKGIPSVPDPTHSPGLQAKIRELEVSLRHKKKEELFVLDHQGETVLHVKGNEGAVKLPHRHSTFGSFNSYVAVHNHPATSARDLDPDSPGVNEIFSLADLKMAVVTGVREAIVIGSERTVSVKPGVLAGEKGNFNYDPETFSAVSRYADTVENEMRRVVTKIRERQPDISSRELQADPILNKAGILASQQLMDYFGMAFYRRPNEPLTG